jgi:WD40 repeat protein
MLACLCGHDQTIRCLAVSLDGHLVLTGSVDQTIRVWDVADCRELACFHVESGSVAAVAFSPDNHWLLSGSTDGTIQLWDAHLHTLITTWRDHEHRICAVAFSEGGKNILAASSAGIVTCKDQMANLEVIRQYPNWEAASAAFSLDGRRFAFGAIAGPARIWDSLTQQEQVQLPWAAGDCKFFPLGDRIAHRDCWGDRNYIEVRETQTGAALVRLIGDMGHVRDMKISSDGHTIVTHSNDQTIRIWDARDGHERHRLDSGPLSHNEPLDLSIDGRLLVFGGNILRLWEVESGREVACYQEEARRVIFAPDGTRIAAVFSSWRSQIRIFRTTDLSEVSHFMMGEGYLLDVEQIQFSSDGRRLACLMKESHNSIQRKIGIWDVTNGKQLSLFDGFGDLLAFAADRLWWAVARDTEIVIESRDGKSQVWFPLAAEMILLHPSKNLWVVAAGNHVYLFTLEEA